MAVLFATCVCILAAGFLWFYVVRPILEGYGLIESVSDNQAAPAPLMSRSEAAPAPSMASSLQTDDAQTDRPVQPSGPTPEQYLTLFKALRAAGIKREEIRPALKGVGLKLDNNLWADAAPPESEHVTPIVGRPTNARFDLTDPDYPYQAPA